MVVHPASERWHWVRCLLCKLRQPEFESLGPVVGGESHLLKAAADTRVPPHNKANKNLKV